MFDHPMKSHAHQLLEVLRKRTLLTEDQQKLLERLRAGYEGEMHFFEKIKANLNNDPMSIYNLYLKPGDSHVQIDCLLMFQNEIILFEIKHYRGDFFIENNNWHTLAKKEIKNPLHQLQRAKLMLRQFLNEHEYSLKIKSFLVFTHPEFYLYQAPTNLPIIFHGQLNQFIRRMNNIPSYMQKKHQQIASLLTSSHGSNSPLSSIPTYHYDRLNKGVICRKCHGSMSEDGPIHVICAGCKNVEPFEKALLENIRDFHTLFPNEKITVNTIAEWTNQCVSKHRIRRILSKHFVLVPKGNQSYYVFVEKKLDS